MPPHVLSDFVVSPPAVAEVYPTSEVGTPNRRGYVVPMRMMVKWEVNLRCQGGALNLLSINYPDHGHHGRLPLSRKNADGRPGIEPGTSRLVIRSSDHQATRLVTAVYTLNTKFYTSVEILTFFNENVTQRKIQWYLWKGLYILRTIRVVKPRLNMDVLLVNKL